MSVFFFFNDTATTEIYTLSLHDALPIFDADKAKSAVIKINEWDEKKEDITVVVDGANDVKLFGVTGFGIAFRAQDLVKDLATVTLDEKDLSKIVGLINSHYNLKLELQASV